MALAPRRHVGRAGPGRGSPRSPRHRPGYRPPGTEALPRRAPTAPAPSARPSRARPSPPGRFSHSRLLAARFAPRGAFRGVPECTCLAQGAFRGPCLPQVAFGDTLDPSGCFRGAPESPVGLSARSGLGAVPPSPPSSPPRTPRAGVGDTGPRPSSTSRKPHVQKSLISTHGERNETLFRKRVFIPKQNPSSSGGRTRRARHRRRRGSGAADALVTHFPPEFFFFFPS